MFQQCCQVLWTDIIYLTKLYQTHRYRVGNGNRFVLFCPLETCFIVMNAFSLLKWDLKKIIQLFFWNVTKTAMNVFNEYALFDLMWKRVELMWCNRVKYNNNLIGSLVSALLPVFLYTSLLGKRFSAVKILQAWTYSYSAAAREYACIEDTVLSYFLTEMHWPCGQTCVSIVNGGLMNHPVRWFSISSQSGKVSANFS